MRIVARIVCWYRGHHFPAVYRGSSMYQCGSCKKVGDLAAMGTMEDARISVGRMSE